MRDSSDSGSRRQAHDAEVRRSTRETGLLAGAILLLVMPGWTVFDAVHEPQRVEAFLALRVGTEVAAVAVWALLWHRRIGLRRSEPLVLLLLSLPVVAVAWMVADVGEGSLEAYLLGFTLPLYGSAFLLVWRWQLTAVLVAIAVGALAAALLTGPRPTTRAELTTMAFFVGTSATIAVIGQAYRQRLSWREFSARSALEREQTRTGQLLAELERLSREDGLTGLANRRCWDELLAQRVEQARRSGEGLAVLLCDVDHFKEVNDAGGHARGDAVLRALAECFAARVRGTDLVARLGGDEVGVLCPGASLRDAADLAVELRAALAPVLGGGVTVSVGVAVLRAGDASAEDLLARADEELYRAKLTRDAVWAGGHRWDRPSIRTPAPALRGPDRT